MEYKFSLISSQNTCELFYLIRQKTNKKVLKIFNNKRATNKKFSKAELLLFSYLKLI